MTTIEAKIAELETRLHRLTVNGKDNYGVRRKIERQIRTLRKLSDKGGAVCKAEKK